MGGTKSKTLFIPTFDPAYKGSTYPETRGYFYDYCQNLPTDARGYLLDHEKTPYKNCYSWSAYKADTNFGTKTTDEGCFMQCIHYIKGAIAEWWDGKTNPYPEPDWKCWVVFTAELTLLFLGGILAAVYVFPIFLLIEEMLSKLGGIFSIIGRTIGAIGRQLQSFGEWIRDSVLDIAGYFETAVRVVVDGWRMLVRASEWLADVASDVTGAYRPLVMLNAISLLFWGAENVLLELLELDVEFQGTTAQKIYHILDWPIEVLLGFIEDATGSKGIIYYIFKFFAIPYEAGFVVVSLLLSVIWYMIKQFIDIVKGRKHDKVDEDNV